MEKSKMTEGELGILGRNHCNSVSSGPDNGANNCLASKIWRPKRHGTTKEMVDNLLACGPTQCNIAGHGNAGLLETGSGQDGYNSESDINLWNKFYWEGEFERLATRPAPILSIISCHTGEGEDGADLLYEMAKLLGFPARARTGFAYCGDRGLTFEANSTWQVATPDHRPNPIASPTPHALPQFSNMIFLEEVDSLWGKAAIEDVLVTRLKSKLVSQELVVSYKDDKATQFMDNLPASNLFKLDGTVLAIASHKIEITSNGNVHRFTVFNSRLAILDDDSSIGFYIRNIENII